MVAARPYDDLAETADDLDRYGNTLDFLDTGDDPYSAVRIVFSWSYSALDDRHATAFRRLGLHPGSTLSLHTAAALWDMSLPEARTVVRRLVGAHLVAEPTADRFQLHDLLRAYARELCAHADDEATRQEAQRRMVDEYLDTADRAGRVIMPHRYRVPLDGRALARPDFTDRRSALRWYDEERLNLIDLFRLDVPAFDPQRWKLAYVLRDYFYLTKHMDDWVDSHTAAVAACQRLGDRRAEGMTRNNLGRALLEAGRMDDAEQQYRRAGELLAEVGDVQGVTDSRVNLASILRRQGRYEQALHLQRAALAFYREAGLPRKIGITLRSIARAELAVGRLTDAAGHAREALDEFSELRLDLEAAQTLNTLAQIHHRAGRPDDATTAGTRAAELSGRVGSDYEKARALQLLGAVAAEVGRTDLAVRHWRESEAIFRRLGAEAADAVAAELRRIQPDG
jgi:tetratricopeptide (TPR) repeat protein